MKKIVISAGPIPARLDSVKFITNRFKGGLAMKTAVYLAERRDNDVTLVVWKFTDISKIDKGTFREIVQVNDVFEYYNWFVDHASDYDAFVMAAAVANLTPVHPYDGKFPSHEYRPKDVFDIKFMIAPRAIDEIKKKNPRATLIGYKLFDAQSDEELVEIAKHTLADSKANIIFANTPAEAKTRKLALTQDGAVVQYSFDDHMALINRAIHQEYYRTQIEEMDTGFWMDINVREAKAIVKMFEKTFDGYGTVAVAINGYPGEFMTTSRGHAKGPVVVKFVDNEGLIVSTSGKATLNAPALDVVLKFTGRSYVVHRHRNNEIYKFPGVYVFPGTKEEVKHAQWFTKDGYLEEPGHGYLRAMSFADVDWEKYHETFPEKYFAIHPDILDTVDRFKNEGKKVLELGGNRRPIGTHSYDPFVKPVEESKAVWVTMDEVLSQDWDLVIANNSVNYLSLKELGRILKHTDVFMANTFVELPGYFEQITENEYAVVDPTTGLVHHGLRMPDDTVYHHVFYNHSVKAYEELGLNTKRYKLNSMLVTKGVL